MGGVRSGRGYDREIDFELVLNLHCSARDSDRSNPEICLPDPALSEESAVLLTDDGADGMGLPVQAQFAAHSPTVISGLVDRGGAKTDLWKFPALQHLFLHGSLDFSLLRIAETCVGLNR